MGQDTTAQPLQLLLDFQEVQEQRSQLYSKLSAGFKLYLQNKISEQAYQGLLAQTTQGFSDCSKQVITLESQLSQPPVARSDLAALLRRVQEGEREKLQVTISMQALKAAMALREQRQEAAHTHDHASCHACCDHGSDHDDVEGPTDQECDAAVQEAIVRLDKCVASILDALEDIKYAVQELREENA